MPITPALRRQRQEDCEFKVSLGYIARPCLKNNVRETKIKQQNDNEGLRL
jgi:hypothetical protein